LTDKILLGYEVALWDEKGNLLNPQTVGKPVYLSLHHLAIFGMTELSGKTTTLEGLISRSGLRAIAFITKRGEAGFTRYNLVTPYYKPRADWQFVEGLVNVALGEKVKFEPGMRYAIMKVCRGRKDLKEIQLAARALAKSDKSAFMRSVYEKLDEYLEIVIPELEKWVFSEKLELSEGVNVMDLSGMRLETQHLVIASTIEYAFSKLDHVIVIIPEAWESIPQGKMTPVKWVAQQFIRKGAAIGNYMFLDSQDIGGIDKTPLRQCDNWLMGRMKEAHEVERILKQLLGVKVPAEEIQTLPLGHFYAAIGNALKKVYVLPVGVPENVGVDVALGKRSPESVRDEFLKVKVMEDESLYKEENERLKAEIRFVNGEMTKLRQQLETDLKTLKHLDEQTFKKLQEENLGFKQQLEQDKSIIERLEKESKATIKIREGLAELMIPTSISTPVGYEEAPSGILVVTEQPALTIQKHTPPLTLDDSSVEGKIAILYAEGNLPQDKWFTVSDVYKAFQKHGWNQDPHTREALDKFCQWGYFEKQLSGRRPDYKIKMSVDEAKQKGLLKVTE